MADKIGCMARTGVSGPMHGEPLSMTSPKHRLLDAVETNRDLEGPACPQPFTDVPPGLEEFVPGYLASRREEVWEMIRVLAASDFESLEMLGHNIKGSGASFGFPEISRIGAALQHSAAQADHAASHIQVMKLKDYLDHAAHSGAGE